MTLDEFATIHARHKEAEPLRFSKLPPDRLASADDLQMVQNKLDVVLPEKLVTFLSRYGGGDFLRLAIFSAQPDSRWYLPARNGAGLRNVPHDFLIVSDDGCGGNYGLRIEGRVVGDPIFYNDTDDGSVTRTEYADIFEFVAANAY